VTRDDVIEYLREAIRGFELDPADSDFQRGYQAALEETLKVIETSGDEEE
jgi:hypothetical protein